MKYDISVSVVLFNTPFSELENIVRILQKSTLRLKAFFVDNSPGSGLERAIPDSETFTYIHTGKNLGFGTAHNIAIMRAKESSSFHVVMNSDVDFKAIIFEEMYVYMKANDEVGMMGPKVFNADGTVQYSAKLLPTPANLLIRRFIRLKSLQRRMDDQYEIKHFGFDKIIEIPFLLGCFLFIKMEALDKVGGFDESFFMYMEDVDLTRRIGEHYKTLYYPGVSIYHAHRRESRTNVRLLKYHIISGIKYFNKWGWVFDRSRKKMNERTLAQF